MLLNQVEHPMAVTAQFCLCPHEFGGRSEECLNSRYLYLQLSGVMLTTNAMAPIRCEEIHFVGYAQGLKFDSYFSPCLDNIL